MAGARPTASERVIHRVAAAIDRDPLELPPLYDCVDADALDSLVEEMTDGAVTFTYVGHDVTVRSTGEVLLDERPRR